LLLGDDSSSSRAPHRRSQRHACSLARAVLLCSSLPPRRPQGAAPPQGALRGQEVRYEDFVSREFWREVARGLAKEERAALKAPLVYQEARAAFVSVCVCV
jgi:hypothetical protein